MKKKRLDTMLRTAAAAAVLFALTGCGREATPVGGVTVPETQQETVRPETPSTGEMLPTETQQETAASNPAPVTIEETVMCDSEDLKVTALSLTSDQYYHILTLRVENKMNRDLYVMASRTAVNSFVVEPWMGVDVPAGGSAECEFKVRLKDVAAGMIADIETRFNYSTSDYTVNRRTERVKLETSAAASHDYSYDESGTVLYDAEGIRIICQGFNEEGNPMIYLFSTGELSEGCCVEDYEIFANGKQTDSTYCEWVFPNTRNIAEMELSGKDRDGNELGKLESLQVSFKINKENVADARPVITEPVEIPVP